MPRAKVIDRTPVEILLDNRRADVRGSGHCRRVSELLSDEAHHGGDHAPGFALGLADPSLSEADGGRQRAAPGTEVLAREFVPHMLLDVLVQLSRGEVEDVFARSVAEQLRTP